MQLDNLLVLLLTSLFMLVFSACIKVVSCARQIKEPLNYVPSIIELTTAIQIFTILIAVAAPGLLPAAPSPGLPINTDLFGEIYYFTSILVLILFQKNKQPELPN